MKRYATSRQLKQIIKVKGMECEFPIIFTKIELRNLDRDMPRGMIEGVKTIIVSVENFDFDPVELHEMISEIIHFERLLVEVHGE